MGRFVVIAVTAAAWTIFAPVAIEAQAAFQLTTKKIYCTRVGGKVTVNPSKAPDRLPYQCSYPDKYDRSCERKYGVEYYYDLASGDCACDDELSDDC